MTRREITVVGIPLLLVTLTYGQSNAGSVTFSVVTSFGKSLPGGQVRIDGQHFHGVVTIKGRTTVTLPYGTYCVTSDSSGYYWGTHRIVEVMTPKMYVLIALPRKESFALFGEGTQTPYRISGTLTFGHRKNRRLFIRLRALYLSEEVEAEIQSKVGTLRGKLSA